MSSDTPATGQTTDQSSDAITVMAQTARKVAGVIDAYYQGLASLPEPLRDRLTQEFATEINKAMGATLGKGAAR